MDHVSNDYAPASSAPISARGTGPASGPPRPARLVDEAASLAALWTELVSGFCKIEHAEFTPQSCSVIVTRQHRHSPSHTAQRLPARDIEILERSLLEGVRKSVAADYGLCPSSIAEILRRCFVSMGLSCWPSRIPLLIVMAAHAKHSRPSARATKAILSQNQQYARQSICVARPDNELSSWLSPAEYAVTRLLVEGRSYEEMAALRHTSKRTVANQLASAFHRLRISGRAELLCLLAARSVASWQEGSSVAAGFAAVAEPVSGLSRLAVDLPR